jgi:hypothetical protein
MSTIQSITAGLFALAIEPEEGDEACAAVPEPVPVPLKSVDVDVDVAHIAARVTVNQVYVNESARPIEAVYRFPVDEKAAVCGFEADINGRKVIGVIKGNEEAREEYTAAVAQGHGAYLLEQQSADIFEMKIGNIPPGAQVNPYTATFSLVHL